MDKAKSIYHIWEPGQFSHRCKLRPFCAEFLMKAMEDFEVHFNTAATRTYGLRIIEALKAEIFSRAKRPDLGGTSAEPSNDFDAKAAEKLEAFRKQVELTFNEQRLITRDDGAKYSVSMDPA